MVHTNSSGIPIPCISDTLITRLLYGNQIRESILVLENMIQGRISARVDIVLLAS